MPRRLLELLALAALVAAVVVLWPRQHERPPPYYADGARTPGVLNPDVTQATIGSTICVHGWTRTVRPSSTYTGELKLRQMREYGVRGSPSAYQEDHLISLELGGDPAGATSGRSRGRGPTASTRSRTSSTTPSAPAA